MTTTEEAIADANRDAARFSLIFNEGWWACDCGCGDIYDPDAEFIEINGRTYRLECLREEYGLVPETVAR